MSTAEEFVRQGLYIEACAQADREFAESSDYAAVHAKVCAFWFMEMYAEAADLCLEIVTRPRSLRQMVFPRTGWSRLVCDLGVSYWLAGERTAALAAWKQLRGAMREDQKPDLPTRAFVGMSGILHDYSLWDEINWDLVHVSFNFEDVAKDRKPYCIQKATSNLLALADGVVTPQECLVYLTHQQPTCEVHACHWGYWMSRILAMAGESFYFWKCLEVASQPHPQVLLMPEYHLARRDFETSSCSVPHVKELVMRGAAADR